MITKKKAPLLPSGFYDLLPPDAAAESHTVTRLLEVFSSFGYEQVSPPLMEFEASLLAGRGEELSKQTFRVLDPVSHEMMGVRTDMTLQVGRVAASRLTAQPRPARLCYAGQIVQSKPEPLRSERQLTQAGIELIGSDALQADVEVVTIAAESLQAIGINTISIDINLPGLVNELCPEARDNKSLQEKIRDAVLQKNTGVVAALPVKNSNTLAALMEAAGSLDKALASLKKYKIAYADSIAELAARIAKNCPKLKLTLDPIEYRGFDYHSGISFSVFAKGLRHELGRGGRYVVDGEHATGFTFYVTHLLKLLPPMEKKQTVIVTDDTSLSTVRDLHKQGLRTVYALTSSPAKEARALGIGFQLADSKGKIEKV